MDHTLIGNNISNKFIVIIRKTFTGQWKNFFSQRSSPLTCVISFAKLTFGPGVIVWIQ